MNWLPFSLLYSLCVSECFWSCTSVLLGLFVKSEVMLPACGFPKVGLRFFASELGFNWAIIGFKLGGEVGVIHQNAESIVQPPSHWVVKFGLVQYSTPFFCVPTVKRVPRGQSYTHTAVCWLQEDKKLIWSVAVELFTCHFNKISIFFRNFTMKSSNM